MTKRQKIPINFNWYFTKKIDNYKLEQYDESNMEQVDIPHNNFKSSFNNFTDLVYQFESIYKKEFEIDKLDNKRYFIIFEGVLHEAKVTLNGNYIGTHLGGYVPFKFEITNFIKNGRNSLYVEVDSRESLNTPPFGKTIDYLTFGGIYREVSILEVNENYIEKIDVASENLLNNPLITINVKTSKKTNLILNLLKDGENLLEIKGKSNEDISFNYDVLLWDTNNPHLYNIKASLENNDELIITTGFREISFKSDGFYLNGIHTKIIGVNRHQIYPYVGYAMPKSAELKDAQILRNMGNAVRTSHYPQSKHFINECDRLGLLVFTEAPGWQSIGDEIWQERYLEQVKIMVNEYKNHPSIILWGVRVNESGDNHDLYSKTNALARSLDSRPTGGVRCISFSEMLEDVYTYNDFFHNGTNNYTKDIDEVINKDYPYLITEFNGHIFPTKSFDNSNRKLQHALRYAHILDAHLGNARVSGSFGWQFIDYYTHKEFGSGDNICYHGIYDMFRMPKPAARIYESQFANDPYLEPLHNNSIGDFDASYIDSFNIASNCEYVDVYKNDEFLDRFYPRKDMFPNLYHPLYVLDDLYGDSYDKININKEDAKEYKSLARLAAKRGGLDKLTKHDKIDREKLKIAWDMYGKHIANWGSDTYTYKLIGYYKGKTIERFLGPSKTYEYKINVDSKKLIIGDTYDVTRITIEAIDNLGNLKPYSNDSFYIDCSENLSIIGEKYISLIGGVRAFWVRTEKKGTGSVTIKNDRMTKEIFIEILENQ